MNGKTLTKPNSKIAENMRRALVFEIPEPKEQTEILTALLCSP